MKIILRIYKIIIKLYVQTLRLQKTVILNQSNSSVEIAAIIKKKKFTSILIITDKTIIANKLHFKITKELKLKKIQHFIYDNVIPNPTVQNVNEASEIYRQNGCAAIIAIGGGSVIDCAKLASVVVLSGKPVQSYDRLIPFIRARVPLIAIPTTSGSGSEVTMSAVITDTARKKKMPISDKKLVPDYVILDPDYTKKLPKEITAATGMDALTHAVESYIGTWSFKESRQFAKDAVKLVLKNLEKAYSDGTDKDTRANMALAATYGGFAFRLSSLGYCHAVAHRMSELYAIPHGLANAIILPHVLDFSFESCYKKLAELAVYAEIGSDKKTEKENAELFIAKIKNMNRKMKIPAVIKEIKNEDIPLIAKRAAAEANAIYPVPKIMNRKELTEFIFKLKG